MGDQLAAQYDRATGGMREVLKFGCMMLMLESYLVQRGQGSGNGVKGDGVKAWLEEHAQGVQRSTAYRFKDVAKAVAQNYQLPARVMKALTFEQLVTAETKELNAPAQKAQAEVFEYVAGTSQKSWLDQFKPAASRGGDTSKKQKKLTAEQEHAQFLTECKEEFERVLMALDRLHAKERWQAKSITPAMREAAAELCADFAKQTRAWDKNEAKK